MKRFDYQIDRRTAQQHRPGHFCLQIEGIDAEITVDPAQFTKKATREVLGAGGSPNDVAAIAEICERYARTALERRVMRMRTGQYAGGVDIGKRKGAISGGTASEMANRKRGSEEAAVERFLNRGKLNGLTKEARLERMARAAQQFDNQADWIERRKNLIASREADLAHWEAEAANGNPKAEKNIRNLRAEIAALTGSGIFNASHGFQYAYTQYLTGAVDLASDDIRIWPLMTNTTLDTVRDAVDQFSDVTADEFDGANYSSGGLALDSQAVAVDDANDRAEFDAADETVSALGAGTRSIQGVALGKFNTNTAGSLPLHWLEFASNKTPDGSDFTFAFNAEGILQAADG